MMIMEAQKKSPFLRLKTSESGITLLLFLIFWLSIPSLVLAVDYQYTELSPFPGAIGVSIRGINKSGVVVGWGTDGSTWKGFLYSSGTYTELLVPGWTYTIATAINDSGVVVGECSDGSTRKGFLYSDGTYTELLPPGWTYAGAYAINNSGVVVGWGSDGSTQKGFVYSGGTYTELLPPGWTYVWDIDINNNGIVVGMGYDDPYVYPRKGFVYSGGTYTELLPPGWTYAGATDINDNGIVIGWGSDGSTQKGFVYSGGTYSELLPPGWTRVAANGINNNGVVVGAGGPYPGIGKGFVYSGGTYSELLPPGWTDAGAIDVNDSGVIVGMGSDGTNHKGFIATPPSQCNPPVQVRTDDSGALGLFEGIVHDVEVGDTTTANVDIQGTDLIYFPFATGLDYWMSIKNITFEPDGIGDFQPNGEDAIGSEYADRRLVAPGTHASFQISFCKPGKVTFELDVDAKAAAYTIGDAFLSIVGHFSLSQLNSFVDDINAIDEINWSIVHLQRAVNAAKNGNLRTAQKELTATVKYIKDLALNKEHLKTLQLAYMKLQVDIGLKTLASMVLRVPVKLIKIVGDAIVIFVQSDWGDKTIQISFIGEN